MHVSFSDHYTIPLPEAHRFPMTKYRLLRETLLAQGVLMPSELFASPLASEALLELVHTRGYVESMRDGTVEPSAMKRVGFPWSYELYDRSRASVAGTVEAAHAALRDGVAGNLAGGTHHAHTDRGEGFCVFNDIAVATRDLQNLGVRRIAIVDLDVHQGDGNASILGRDEGVFVFSMHGEKNYPFTKERSHLDIALPDGVDDETYLAQLEAGLREVESFVPDFVFYQAGVDSLKEDALGRMNLTIAGLMKRDELVLRWARERRTPICLTLGGGYAKPIELTVEAYANTYRVAKTIFEGPASARP